MKEILVLVNDRIYHLKNKFAASIAVVGHESERVYVVCGFVTNGGWTSILSI